jgi:signal recognition particle subunit SRP54
MEHEPFTLGAFRNLIAKLDRREMFPTLLKDTDRAEIRRLNGIIDAMTPDERRNPAGIVNRGRRFRIAVGAGVAPSEVRQLVRQFVGMIEMMRKLRRMHDW